MVDIKSRKGLCSLIPKDPLPLFYSVNNKTTRLNVNDFNIKSSTITQIRALITLSELGGIEFSFESFKLEMKQNSLPTTYTFLTIAKITVKNNKLSQKY